MGETTAPTVSVHHALEQRTKKHKKFTESAINSAGIALRLFECKDPGLPTRKAARFITTAVVYRAREKYISRLKGYQEERKTELKETARSNPGLRGVVARARNWKIAIDPSYSIKWNREKLKEKLGDSYPAVVNEDLEMKIAVPNGQESANGSLTAEKMALAAKAGLYALIGDMDEVDKLVTTKVSLRVDEPRLHEMVKNGQVNVEDAGAATETWGLEISRIDQLSPIDGQVTAPVPRQLHPGIGDR